MSVESIMHTVGVLTCATTLSLFTTIVAYAAVNVAPLKWDGSLCAGQYSGQHCSGLSMVANSGAARIRVARTGAGTF